ncbi:MAG: hypothetical protein ACXW4C_12045, partial [Nitrospira sp.]
AETLNRPMERGVLIQRSMGPRHIVRSSAETFGLPTRLRDRQRQYARNPARCQRMTVSGLTIATAPRTEGNQQ